MKRGPTTAGIRIAGTQAKAGKPENAVAIVTKHIDIIDTTARKPLQQGRNDGTTAIIAPPVIVGTSVTAETPTTEGTPLQHQKSLLQHGLQKMQGS
jgi:hypothetical protein